MGKETRVEEVPAHEVDVFSVGDRRVFFISDLHLDPTFKGNSPGQLRNLVRLLEENPDALFIFGGDLYEAALCESKRLPELIRNYRHSKYASQRLMAEFHDLLQMRDTLAIYGNHDPEKWYGEFGKKFFDFMGAELILEFSNGKRILVELGNRYYKNRDEVIYTDIFEMMQSPFLTIFDKQILSKEPLGLHKLRYYMNWEAFMVNLLGDTYLRRRRLKKINKYLEKQAEVAAGIYGVDSVMMGHSHLGKISEKALIAPLTRFGQVGWIALENGEPRIQYVTYNGFEWGLEISRRLVRHLLFRSVAEDLSEI